MHRYGAQKAVSRLLSVFPGGVQSKLVSKFSVDGAWLVLYLFLHERNRHLHLPNTMTDPGTDPGLANIVFLWS